MFTPMSIRFCFVKKSACLKIVIKSLIYLVIPWTICSFINQLYYCCYKYCINYLNDYFNNTDLVYQSLSWTWCLLNFQPASWFDECHFTKCSCVFCKQKIYANFKVFKVFLFCSFLKHRVFYNIFLQHSFSLFYAFFRETYHFAFAFSHFCFRCCCVIPMLWKKYGVGRV